MEADCDLVDSPDEEDIRLRSFSRGTSRHSYLGPGTSSRTDDRCHEPSRDNRGGRYRNEWSRDYQEEYRGYPPPRELSRSWSPSRELPRSWSPPRDYSHRDTDFRLRDRHRDYQDDRIGERDRWSDRFDERKRQREPSDGYSRESKRMRRSSSRNSYHSYSNDDHSEMSGAQSFEDMARGILAGTLRDDVSSGQTPGLTMTTPPPVPMFGAPMPDNMRRTDFELLRDQQQAVTMFAPPPAPSHPVILDIERDQGVMAARVVNSLASVDLRPSRFLRLDRSVSPEELTQIYQTICPNPCDHMECQRLFRGVTFHALSRHCIFFPKVTVSMDPYGHGETNLEFLTEIRAAIFRSVLSQHNISSSFIQGPVSMISLKETSRVVKAEEKVGIPRRYHHESYLLCTVVMDLMTSSSVEHGTVSAPFKISIYSGQ